MRDAAEIAQQKINIAGNIVLANDADEIHAGAERHQVTDYVAGTAEHRGFILHPADRDRCFGRYASDVAIHETVKHHVANANHPGGCQE